MEFVFKVISQPKDAKSIDRLRRQMLAFEQMTNATMPDFRIHLEER